MYKQESLTCWQLASLSLSTKVDCQEYGKGEVGDRELGEVTPNTSWARSQLIFNLQRSAPYQQWPSQGLLGHSLDRSDEEWTGEELTLSISSHPPKVKVSVAQLCPTLCDPMDCSSPGSSVHGILQARILEWIAIPLSWGSSWPRDQTWISYISGRFFTTWATREAVSPQLIPSEFVTLNWV